MLRPGILVSWQLYQTVGVKLCTGALNIPREAEQTWRRQQSWDCRSYRLNDLTTETVRIAQPRPALQCALPAQGLRSTHGSHGHRQASEFGWRQATAR